MTRPDTSFTSSDVKCTCGEHLDSHQNGRCADAILHRLAYRTEPQEYPKDTEYFDGLRYHLLFEPDYLYTDEEGELRKVPQYTSDPAEAFRLFVKWGDMGGTARINMNMSGWSASFSHNNERYYSYRSRNHLKRSRLEWLTIRKLSFAIIQHLRDMEVDECVWLEGVNPIERNPSP